MPTSRIYYRNLVRFTYHGLRPLWYLRTKQNTCSFRYLRLLDRKQQETLEAMHLQGLDISKMYVL